MMGEGRSVVWWPQPPRSSGHRRWDRKWHSGNAVVESHFTSCTTPPGSSIAEIRSDVVLKKDNMGIYIRQVIKRPKWDQTCLVDQKSKGGVYISKKMNIYTYVYLTVTVHCWMASKSTPNLLEWERKIISIELSNHIKAHHTNKDTIILDANQHNTTQQHNASEGALYRRE